MADRKKHTDVFREKSLEQVSSPESLDKYIRSTTPSLWLLLGTIILVLVGVIAWSSFGKIDSASVVGCRAEGGIVTSYIKEAEYEKLCDASYVEVNGEQYPVASVTGPAIAGEESDSFLTQAAELEDGAWYYTVTCRAPLADGEYKGRVVYEQISPITFIIN